MSQQFLLYFRFMASTAMFLFFGACAVQQPVLPTGVIGQTLGTYVFEAYSGYNQLVGIKYIIPRFCAGKTIVVQAIMWTDATGVYGGRKSFHRVHMDAEMFRAGHSMPQYNDEPFVAISTVPQQHTRIIPVPADFIGGQVRIGPQGVAGKVYIQDAIARGCD